MWLVGFVIWIAAMPFFVWYVWLFAALFATAHFCHLMLNLTRAVLMGKPPAVKSAIKSAVKDECKDECRVASDWCDEVDKGTPVCVYIQSQVHFVNAYAGDTVGSLKSKIADIFERTHAMRWALWRVSYQSGRASIC
jgi:hypothetical protein